MSTLMNARTTFVIVRSLALTLKYLKISMSTPVVIRSGEVENDTLALTINRIAGSSPVAGLRSHKHRRVC